MIGVISGAAATFVVVAVRLIVAGMCQPDASTTSGAASCRMHCGSDGANIEVMASSVPPQSPPGHHHEEDYDEAHAPPAMERQRSRLEIAFERMRAYAQHYRRTLVRSMSESYRA